MTPRRKSRLKTKIMNSRARLMETNPFFALMLMHLDFISVPEMKKISTNGKSIFFSPDFIDKLYEYELDYILCHQIMHIVGGHIWKESDISKEDYHFACDILINVTLIEFGFTDKRYPHLGNINFTAPGTKNFPAVNATPEEVFDLMPFSVYILDEKTRNRFYPDSTSMWDEYSENKVKGEIILDTPDRDAMLCTVRCSVSPEKHWKLLAAETSQIIARNSKNFSRNRFLTKLRDTDQTSDSLLDWRKILTDFVQENICDYSFSPPDRRFSDAEFFLPDFNESDYSVKDILFMADASGSVNDSELSLVYSEIKGALEQFDGKLQGMLGFFDTGITPPVPFETVSDLNRVKPYGGGGTDFFAVFEYINQIHTRSKPACIVVFTDGYGEFPDESSAEGIPVLWIINNHHVTPPWGKTARLIKASL